MVCKQKRHGWAQRIGMLGVAMVFLLQTLAWSGMPVFVAGDGGNWVSICTSDGFQRVSLRNADFFAESTSPDAPRPASVNYCDLCVFAQGLNTGFAQMQVHAVRAVAAVSMAVFIAAPISAGLYPPNQPRAPPLVS